MRNTEGKGVWREDQEECEEFESCVRTREDLLLSTMRDKGDREARER